MANNNPQQPQNEPRRAQPGQDPERREDQDMERDGGQERDRDRERQDKQNRPQ